MLWSFQHLRSFSLVWLSMLPSCFILKSRFSAWSTKETVACVAEGFLSNSSILRKRRSRVNKRWSREEPVRETTEKLACSRLSVSGDARQSTRATSGISEERDQRRAGCRREKESALVACPLSRSSPLTESLDEATENCLSRLPTFFVNPLVYGPFSEISKETAPRNNTDYNADFWPIKRRWTRKRCHRPSQPSSKLRIW